MKNFPESFNDPLYAELDADQEKKLSLPVGLLSSIRTAGERSNASATNKFGTSSPYQFTPPTRKAILDKYGIDVLLSPENASEGAALLLQESLKRNKGDVETAIREYHGGTNPENWGPVNNAYAKRVLAAQNGAKQDAMTSGFAKFMADNPAVPAGDRGLGQAAATPATATTEPSKDALASGFGNWLAANQKSAVSVPVEGAAAIPGLTPEQQAQNTANQQAAGYVTPQSTANASLVDKLIGAGETGLTLLTGATGGTLGALGGTIGGLAGSIANGEFGTQQGVERVGEAAQKGSAGLTYVPRTAAGQEMVQNVGESLSALPPVIPIAPEIAAAARSAPIAQQIAATATEVPGVARAAVPAAVNRIRQAPAQISERVQRVMNRNPEVRAAGGSVGAAGADVAAQRQAQASNLPAPIDLTLGERTRSPEQLKFEVETSKLPVGQALRERVAENNQKIYQNFDSYIDETGAQANTLRQTGMSVDDALVKKAGNAKNEVNIAYRKARDSAEAQLPVNPDEIVQIGSGENAIQNSVVGYINSKPAGLNSTGLLDDARKLAVRLGIADMGEEGTLIAKPTTVAKMEEFRKEVSGATGFEPSDIRDSLILKGLIDSTTEPVAGPLYRNARRLRENFAKQFEDHAVINKLLTKKRGTSDRNVALEDVFDHSIIKGSLDDVRQVRRTLTAHGADVPEAIQAAGNQAWKDLQGQTIAYIRDRTFGLSATDAKANPVASANAFVKTIRELDKEGKLDYILGKKGAENMRDLRDVVQLVKTAPPEAAINASNTAATVLAALGEAGATGAITGLPVPVLTTLKYLAGRSKDMKLRKKIDQALERTSQIKKF